MTGWLSGTAQGRAGNDWESDELVFLSTALVPRRHVKRKRKFPVGGIQVIDVSRVPTLPKRFFFRTP